MPFQIDPRYTPEQRARIKRNLEVLLDAAKRGQAKQEAAKKQEGPQKETGLPPTPESLPRPPANSP